MSCAKTITPFVMDPLSLCACILTVLTSAQAGVKILQEVKHCWKAPQEIDTLLLEIESLQSILHDIASFVESSQSTAHSESLSHPVLRASSILDSIVALLSLPTSGNVRRIDANRARLTWLRRKNEIKRLLRVLIVARADLSLKLGFIVV
ncbi:MAG: hypothetical protein Q9220_007248 [cf. Caloplaca sp. 1 TL-2023]